MARVQFRFRSKASELERYGVSSLIGPDYGAVWGTPDTRAVTLRCAVQLDTQLFVCA
jgi:hypothetical protein